MNKHNSILFKSAFAIAVLLFSATALHAQNLDKSTVQRLLQSKEFTFKAQTALPMAGAAKPLTYDYEVKFLGDSINSYLPYFGRAYAAVYPGEGGISFTSTKFDYNYKQKGENRWDIVVKPKDTRDVREFNFTVYDNGSAYLQVFSNNRQPISYNGYITERK
jgi:hypothetical protein